MRLFGSSLRLSTAVAAALGCLSIIGGGAALSASAAAAASTNTSVVYATQTLSPKSFGEVVAEVPANTSCWLSISLHGKVETRSSRSKTATGQMDFTWTVPPEVTAGTRIALVDCADGLSASTAIRVRGGVKQAGHPLANVIHVTPIKATEPPLVAGKGGGGYPPYGSVILPAADWFEGHGVNVYSDGGNGADGYYQCVELANRFMTSEHFGPVIWGNANQLYADAQSAYYQTHPNGSGYIPVPGDLVVFGGGEYGHVAVVDTVTSTSVNLVEQNASPTGRTTISLSGSTLGGLYGLYVIGVIHAKADTSSNGTSSTSIQSPPPSSSSGNGSTEVAGGTANTWSNPTTAGGIAGARIPALAAVSVVCRVNGYAVPDGNTWWYLIGSSPWDGDYYASADAFYNNGQTTGSLLGTPFVDTNVPMCVTRIPSPSTSETSGSVVHTWSNPAEAGGNEGAAIPSNTTIQVTCRLNGFTVADGNSWWYEIASSPWNNTYYASADAFYNNGQTSGSLLGTPFVDTNVPLCTTQTPPPPPPPTFPETSGSVVHTWTNPANAGGSEGPSIPSNATVNIVCRLTGFVVADGNPWWYLIGSSPWSGSYYGSADAFYNNGQTSGSLLGTPFVDPNVPMCGSVSLSGTAPETTGGVTHTWTNPQNAGGSEGPSIPAYTTVQVTCRLTGFTVQDGNPWWYEIASSPWGNAYFASADAFYNNGQTLGSLLGTPFVDTNVPLCS